MGGGVEWQFYDVRVTHEKAVAIATLMFTMREKVHVPKGTVERTQTAAFWQAKFYQLRQALAAALQ